MMVRHKVVRVRAKGVRWAKGVRTRAKVVRVI